MSEKPMEVYWQNGFKQIKDRGLYLLHSEKWFDCKFLVGISPKQRILTGHKLILAMSSPVFERMFFGNLPEESDAISIPDVQPDVFQTMLEYIYSDIVNIASFDKAFELYYVAQKYMLPFLMEHCTTFLMENVNYKNACHIYEFAKFYSLSPLMQKSMSVIAQNTILVLEDPSFLDIPMSTLIAILEEDKLSIGSELELFNALAKYATKHEKSVENEKFHTEHLSASKKDLRQQMGSCKNGSNILQNEKENNHGECVVDDVSNSDTSDTYVEKEHTLKNTSSSDSNVITSVSCSNIKIEENPMRKAIQKIRFRTLTPKQFAEGPALSKLLTQHEAFAIFIKISSPRMDYSWPEGFCTSTVSRCLPARQEKRAMEPKFGAATTKSVPWALG